MSNLERSGSINEAFINGKHYFVSLLSEASECGLISSDKINKIRTECLELLAKKSLEFTNGKSSSVRTEDAEAIMNSVFFTIGLSLKEYPSVYDAVDALNKYSIRSIFTQGERKLGIKVNTAHLYAALVAKTMIKSNNYTYNSTLTDGINGFFKVYNRNFGADRTEITADYPLCVPIEDLTGIEFICKYLESVFYENSFCGLFSNSCISAIINGAYNDTAGSVFNIFGTVLSACLCEELCGGNIFSPAPTKAQISILSEKLSKLGIYEIRVLFSEAAKRICKKQEIKNSAEINYVIKSAESISKDVQKALSLNCIDTVFTVSKGN